MAGVAGSERGVDPISALVATTFGIAGETVSQLAVPFLKSFLQVMNLLKMVFLQVLVKKHLEQLVLILMM